MGRIIASGCARKDRITQDVVVCDQAATFPPTRRDLTNLIKLHIPTKITTIRLEPGRVAQSVTCPATDVCLTAVPGVASSILARSYTFVGFIMK